MKHVKRVWTLAAALMFIVLLSGQALALEAFEITAYDVSMDVRNDNSYRVTETIDVRFSELRRGIIRSLPLKTYRGEWAAVSGVKVEEHAFSTSKESGYLHIKIGDPDSYASETERYVISYTYAIGEDGLPDMDELYWNLIGSEWDCAVSQVSFSIAMPQPFDERGLNFTWGSYGSVQNEQVSFHIEGNVITGALAQSLMPKQALTIALPLPQGYFYDAKTVPGGEGFFDRSGWLVSVPAVGAGIGAWVLFGRKKRMFPTVEFYPPAGVTSADVGYLIDGRVDPYDITSLIIYWADKGYLSIYEREIKRGFKRRKSFLLTRLSDPSPDAKPYEREMFHTMFQLGNGTQVDTEQLTNRFYRTVDAVKKRVRLSFEENEQTRIFDRSNNTARWALRLLGVLVPLPVVYIVLRNETGGQGLGLLGQSALLSLVIMVLLFYMAHMAVNYKATRKAQIFTTAAYSVIVLGALMFAAYDKDLILYEAVSLIGVLLLGVLATVSKRRTKLGDWYLERLIGLKEFIKATEKDRIKLLADENPRYFYHILPYAMVLGVTDRWAKHFETITVEPPSWYQTTTYGAFAAARFAQDIESGMKTVSSSMHARPSESGGSGGSAGGGSAGGGSGGGGGSSW